MDFFYFRRIALIKTEDFILIQIMDWDRQTLTVLIIKALSAQPIAVKP